MRGAVKSARPDSRPLDATRTNWTHSGDRGGAAHHPECHPPTGAGSRRCCQAPPRLEAHSDNRCSAADAPGHLPPLRFLRSCTLMSQAESATGPQQFEAYIAAVIDRMAKGLRSKALETLPTIRSGRRANVGGTHLSLSANRTCSRVAGRDASPAARPALLLHATRHQATDQMVTHKQRERQHGQHHQHAGRGDLVSDSSAANANPIMTTERKAREGFFVSGLAAPLPVVTITMLESPMTPTALPQC
jgi:hypothetical protein